MHACMYAVTLVYERSEKDKITRERCSAMVIGTIHPTVREFVGCVSEGVCLSTIRKCLATKTNGKLGKRRNETNV